MRAEIAARSPTCRPAEVAASRIWQSASRAASGLRFSAPANSVWRFFLEHRFSTQLLFNDREGSAHFSHHYGEIRREQCLLRIDDYIRRNTNRRKRNAHCFTQAPLHSVALDGAAESPTHRESHAQPAKSGCARPLLRTLCFHSRPIKKSHGGGKMPPSLFINALEIRMAQKTRGAGESCSLWRHRGLQPNSQQSIRQHPFARRRAAERIDCGSERH